MRSLPTSAELPTGTPIGEVLIIDNDAEPSARPTVERLAADRTDLALRYVHEPRPGLSAARNRALDEARGRILVFIDDDEVAGPGWPAGLVTLLDDTGAGLAGGPVRNRFTVDPPTWASDVLARPEPAEGSVQKWLRTGNLAIDLAQIRSLGIRFDDAFGRTGGEDVAFSWAARRAGVGLRWTNDAVVYEYVGPERTTLRWATRRARTTTVNWVRVELTHHPHPTRRLLIAARGTTRLAQGIATVAAGALRLDRTTAAAGLVRASRGLGSLQGALGHRAGDYRGTDPEPVR